MNFDHGGWFPSIIHEPDGVYWFYFGSLFAMIIILGWLYSLGFFEMLFEFESNNKTYVRIFGHHQKTVDIHDDQITSGDDTDDNQAFEADNGYATLTRRRSRVNTFSDSEIS